jgi:DNA-binding transcriptional LysR family regulator
MIDKLEFLLALAREQHFGRAAETCGVTQSTLSAGVKQLEDTFGVLLVIRGSRFQGFTPEGERVLDWARRIVGDTRTMRQEIEALRHGLAGRLRIAAIPTTLDGGGDHHAVSCSPPQRPFHDPVAHLDRDPDAFGES